MKTSDDLRELRQERLDEDREEQHHEHMMYADEDYAFERIYENDAELADILIELHARLNYLAHIYSKYQEPPSNSEALSAIF